jgi:hypothetical protein
MLDAELGEDAPALRRPRYKYLLGGRLTSPCDSNMHGIARPDRGCPHLPVLQQPRRARPATLHLPLRSTTGSTTINLP